MMPVNGQRKDSAIQTAAAQQCYPMMHLTQLAADWFQPM
jgi:hypothetical protein